MKDENKTKGQLINELVKMRQRVVELEASETERQQLKEAVPEARESRERVLQPELNLTRRLTHIGEVATGIAHEINNPLTGVIAFAEMLTQMDIPEDIKEAVEVIHNGAKRIAGIVEKLLTEPPKMAEPLGKKPEKVTGAKIGEQTDDEQIVYSYR